MTPNQHLNSLIEIAEDRPALTAAKAASTVCFLAGIWFFVSPRVYGSATNGND
jgi:hypothetical protein